MCKAVNTEPPLTCGGEKMVNILSRDWKDQENFEKPAVDMDETDCKISNKKKKFTTQFLVVLQQVKANLRVFSITDCNLIILIKLPIQTTVVTKAFILA